MDAGAVHRSATRAVAGFRAIPAAVREELAQEATLRTLAQPGVAHPRAFARQVARRLAIDWHRRGAELVALPAEPPAPGCPIARLEARSALRALARCALDAPRRHHEVLSAFGFDQSSMDEVVRDASSGPPGDDPHRRRDRWYKRRRRALSWFRARLDG